MCVTWDERGHGPVRPVDLTEIAIIKGYLVHNVVPDSPIHRRALGFDTRVAINYLPAEEIFTDVKKKARQFISSYTFYTWSQFL